MVRSFISQSGISIRIGESDRENDALIKSAHQNYVWCHLQNAPSPHAIIESPEPDPQTLNLAMQLVKYFSKQRKSVSSNMIYTEVKNVYQDSNKAGLVHLKKKPCTKTIKTNNSSLREFGLMD